MDYMLALGRMFLIAVTEHRTDQLAAGKGDSWLSFRDSQGEGSRRVGCNLAPRCLHHPVSLLCLAEGAHCPQPGFPPADDAVTAVSESHPRNTPSRKTVSSSKSLLVSH